MSLLSKLTPANAFIFRITHRHNIPWILDNGLWAPRSGRADAGFVSIGNASLIQARADKAVPIPPYGVLGDYVPFYFTPYSMMLFNVITGRNVPARPKEDIVVLVSSLHRVIAAGRPYVFTDRHAHLGYVTADHFSSDLNDLARMVPWQLLQTKDFQRDEENPEKTDKYQAEALVHEHLPTDALLGLVAYNVHMAEGLRTEVENRGLTLDVHVRQSWYF